jgi:hypothetical protein
MAPISQSVTDLLGGVSQRPANRRKANELASLINGYTNHGRGLQKRPPVDYIAKLQAITTGYDTAFLHTIQRDITERYHVIITNGDLKVYDALSGEAKLVNFPNGKGYLSIPSATSSRGDTFTEPLNLTTIVNHAIAGGNWTQWKNVGVFSSTIVSNQAKVARAGSTTESYLWPQLPPSADYTVSAYCGWGGNGTVSSTVGPIVRGIVGTGGYAAHFISNSQIRLSKLDTTGAIGAIISTVAFASVADTIYKMTLDVLGNRLRVYIDGTLLVDTTDNTFSAAGQAGWYGVGGASLGAYALVDTWTLEYAVTSTGVLNTAAKSFRAVTVGDYTFITNRTQAVAKTVNLVATRPPEALVFVRQADYSTAYKLTVDATTLTHTTGDGLSPASRAGITTDAIAEALRVLFVASALNATHTCTRTGSTLYIKRINNAAFTVSATDGLSDAAILAIKGSIQRFDDLPLRAVNGVIIEVTGDPGSQFDNYHVVYDDSGSAGNAGVWRETVKPGELYQLDPATMPYVLLNAAGVFTFAQAAWRGREVGSTITNPFPSFVGRAVKEVFYTQGRLGFTAGESVILTGVSDIFNFFRKSAKALYDSDPIDVNAASDKVMNWHSALEWNKIPLLWSDQGQALLEGDANGVLSPKTVSLNFITSYENQPTVRPRMIGNTIYFAQIINGKTRLSAYGLPQNATVPAAYDLTGHIPSYIIGNVLSIVGTDQPNLIAVTTDVSRNAIYILATDDQTLAWSRWDIESTSQIIGMDFIGGVIGILVKRSDGIYLEKIDLGKTNLLASAGDVVPVLLDHSTVPVGVFTSLTTYTLPFSVATNGSEGEVVLWRTDTQVEVPSLRPTATTVTAVGNTTAIPIVMGIRYTFTAVLSPLFIRGSEGKVETTGRLQVHFVRLLSQDTTYVRATVTPVDSVTYTYTTSTIGTVAAYTVSQIPVMGKNEDTVITILNDSPRNTTYAGLDWESTYASRARRS